MRGSGKLGNLVAQRRHLRLDILGHRQIGRASLGIPVDDHKVDLVLHFLE